MILKTDKLKGHILAAFTIIIWGTTFIASKILLKQFMPLQIMIMRFAIAYVTLLILNHKFRKTSLHEEFIFFILALTGTTVYFLFENTALSFTFASNVSILLSVTPILTAILAHFFTKDEKLNRNIFTGSVIAFVGTALVVFNGTVVLRLNPLGDILTFGAALSWSVYSVILKNHVNGYDPIYLTRKVVFYAVVMTLPLVFIEGKPFSAVSFKIPSVIISILFLGILGSALCYAAWNVATAKLGIVTTNNYIYLSPFVTMVAAGVILGEKITFMGVAGASMIVAGVVLAGIKANKLSFPLKKKARL